MNCQDFEMLMADALGEELSPDSHAAFSAHLAECTKCRTAYKDASSVIELMRTVSGPARVTVTKEGNRLILENWKVGSRSRSQSSLSWTRRVRRHGAVFRYAASVLIAFAAGYAFRAGVPITQQTPGDLPFARPSVSDGDTSSATDLQAALATIYQRNPGRSDLAKGLLAVTFGQR